jgi:hypothetical protein
MYTFHLNSLVNSLNTIFLSFSNLLLFGRKLDPGRLTLR